MPRANLMIVNIDLTKVLVSCTGSYGPGGPMPAKGAITARRLLRHARRLAAQHGGMGVYVAVRYLKCSEKLVTRGCESTPRVRGVIRNFVANG